jgi:hypothetical protein
MGILVTEKTQSALMNAATCTVVTRENVIGYYGWMHHDTLKLSNGEAYRIRVTKVHTWKRQPNKMQINFKFGLRAAGYLTGYDLDGGQWHYGEGRNATRIISN